MNKLIIAILIVLLFLLKKYDIIKLDWYTILIFVFIVALLMTGNNNDNNLEHLINTGKGTIETGDLHITGKLTVDGGITNGGDLIFKNADVNKWILTSPTGDDTLFHRPWDPAGKSWSLQKQNAMRLNGNFRIDGGGLNMPHGGGFVNAEGGITTTKLTANDSIYANSNLCLNKNWWFHTPEHVDPKNSNLYIGHSATSSGGDWPSGAWSHIIHKDGDVEIPGNLDVTKKINVHGGLGIHDGDLRINKSLFVDGPSRLGNWQIRNDKIGIEGRGDLNFGADKWMRLLNYDSNNMGDYTGIPSAAGGFAGLNSYTHKTIFGADASIAGWEMRPYKLGIKDRGDFNWEDKEWLDLVKYNISMSDKISPLDKLSSSFTAKNLNSLGAIFYYGPNDSTNLTESKMLGTRRYGN